MTSKTNERLNERSFQSKIARAIKKYGLFYLFALPGIVFFLVFHYFPIFLGIVVSVTNYNPFLGKGIEGILKADWAGLAHFKRLFEMPDFYRLLGNTLRISLSKLIVCFPFPIIFALLLNEVKAIRFKKTIQTITYLPHFISVVVIAGLFRTLLEPDSGALTLLLNSLGFESSSSYLSNSKFYTPLLVGMNVWMKFGWDSIIYLSAITAVDTGLYEAAAIDGAGKLRQCIHVTIPAIVPTIVVMFILNVGHILDAGFQDILLTYSELTYSVADVIDTYLYRLCISGSSYGLSAAMGLFKSVVGVVLVVGANKLSNKLTDSGLW